MEIDHSDRCRLNNMPENLRAVTRKFNVNNTGKRRHNTSGYKGVSTHSSGLWRARARVDGKETTLGYFKDKVAAAAAINAFVSTHYPGVLLPNRIE